MNALHDRGINLSQPARKIGSSRNVVSTAITHGRFQGVLNKVRKELGP
jgi:hypothetical protein